MTGFRAKVCTEIPYMPDEEWLLQRLHCNREGLLFRRSLQLFERGQASFSPAYLLREFPLQRFSGSGFSIGGCEFNSKTVAQRLAGAQTVFIYIATCGRDVGRLPANTKDHIDHYLLDQLAYGAYLRAMSALAADVEADFGLEKYRILCPGSVPDWSVAEVRHFFTLLDGLYQPLGLRVLESGQIVPLKSSSGILYATDEAFESCELCPRPNCENRRTVFVET